MELDVVAEEKEWYQMVNEINRSHAMRRGMVPSHAQGGGATDAEERMLPIDRADDETIRDMQSDDNGVFASGKAGERRSDAESKK